jgi:polysaccharide deacetylase family protein (PEP-CTERM system associated)
MEPVCLPTIRESQRNCVNLLTFDIEDWFHTSALRHFIDEKRWDSLESRAISNVRLILELLAGHQTRATFFILGWMAERYPRLMQEIDQAGHEIASHGYRHRLIYELDRDTFREYVRRSKKLLEDLTGKPVLGYRATSFSIVKDTLWALDILRESGFMYDASMFPVRHDIYGIDGFPRFPFVLENGLIEIPASTLRLGGRNLPMAGGGYLRLYPYWVTKKGIQSLNRSGYPAVVYLHPWELDPDCPRVANADGLTRFRQYVNLHKTKPRLKRLLADFHFTPVSDYITRFHDTFPQGDSFEASPAKL